MRWRWLKWLALSVVALLVVAVSALYLLSRDWAPKKPDSIPQGDYAYTRELADYRFEELLSRHHVPGAAAALIVDQEVVWQQTAGLADIAENQPVTGKTVFKLWSLAKILTALEIMRLVEEGSIDLDASIAEYVPGFRVPSRFGPGEPITVRHLLTHRSGLPRNTCADESNWHLGPDGAERLAATLGRCRLAYPTGSRYKYSNTAYDLLGYVIQAQRGEVFQPYMQRSLLRPIGMADAAFWSTDVPRERHVATGYRYDEDEQHPLRQHDIASVPSGNLYASLDDLVAFAKFVLREGETGGARLIEAETLSAMTVDQGSRPEDPQPMGLGWKLSDAIPGERLVWHDGGPSEGIGAQLALLPERKLGAVFVGNSTAWESASIMPIVIELLEVMLETELGVAPVADEPPPELDGVNTAALEACAGDYVAFGRIMAVRRSGDQLEATLPGVTLDLVPRSVTTFGVSHWIHRLGLARLFDLPMDLDLLKFAFQRGTDGSPDRFILNMGDLAFEIAPRYGPLPGGATSWQDLTGTYQRRSRLPDGSIGAEGKGTAEIRRVDDRLVMSDPIGLVFPLEGGDLVVLGGSFAGETIVRDAGTGTLAHQGYVYVPVE